MPPPKLPAHLSYKSALVLLPPNSILRPIETLRQKHDKHFDRWPPHINLVYPFLADPSSKSGETNLGPPDEDMKLGKHRDDLEANRDVSNGHLKDEIFSRLREAIGNMNPFKIVLSAYPPGHFFHGKRSATVWLDPLDLAHPVTDSHASKTTGASDRIRELQAALQAEFSECNADERPFTPHLSIGQATGKKGMEELSKEVQEVVEDFVREQTEEGAPTIAEPGASRGLEWCVDSVFVIERKGFNDRFKVIGSVTLVSNEDAK